MRVSIEGKADPNLKDNNGETPLQAAAFRGVQPIIDLLLRHGAALKVKGFGGATALHWAVDGQQVETVKLFIDKGADVNALDDEGKTPLAWAQKRSQEMSWWKRLDIVSIGRLLRKAGAK